MGAGVDVLPAHSGHGDSTPHRRQAKQTAKVRQVEAPQTVLGQRTAIVIRVKVMAEHTPPPAIRAVS